MLFDKTKIIMFAIRHKPIGEEVYIKGILVMLSYSLATLIPCNMVTNILPIFFLNKIQTISIIDINRLHAKMHL